MTDFVAFDLHSPTSFEFLDAWWRERKTAAAKNVFFLRKEKKLSHPFPEDHRPVRRSHARQDPPRAVFGGFWGKKTRKKRAEKVLKLSLD